MIRDNSYYGIPEYLSRSIISKHYECTKCGQPLTEEYKEWIITEKHYVQAWCACCVSKLDPNLR